MNRSEVSKLVACACLTVAAPLSARTDVLPAVLDHDGPAVVHTNRKIRGRQLRIENGVVSIKEGPILPFTFEKSTPVTVATDEVRRIEIKHDRTYMGTLIGAGVGLAFAVAGIGLTGANSSEAVIAFLAGGEVIMAIGSAIGHLGPEWQVVYSRPMSLGPRPERESPRDLEAWHGRRSGRTGLRVAWAF